jgi:hypothetical protein
LCKNDIFYADWKLEKYLPGHAKNISKQFCKKFFYYFYLTLVKGQCLEKYAMGRAAIPYMEGAVGRDLAISEIIEGEQQAEQSSNTI